MSILYNLLHKISLLVFSCFYLVVWFYSAILHETQRNPNALPPKHYYLYVAIIILLFTLFFLIDFVIIKKVYICFSVLRTTLIISKKPGNTGISRDIRTEFTTDLLLSD